MTDHSKQIPRIEIVVSAPFMENSLIVSLEGRSACVIVDRGLDPALVLLTHGHADHIGGNTEIKSRWPAVPLVIGHGDADMLTDSVANLSGLAGFPVTSPPADRTVQDQ